MFTPLSSYLMLDTFILTFDAREVYTVRGGRHDKRRGHEVAPRNQEAHVGIMGKHIVANEFTEQLNQVGKCLSVNVIRGVIWEKKLLESCYPVHFYLIF